MKRFLMLLCLAAFSGCISREPKEATSESSLQRQMNSHFGVVEVTSFLRTLIAEHPMVDGVALEKSKIGSSWVIDESWLPVGLTSGDWTFQQGIGSQSGFDLTYRVGPEEAVIFHCMSRERGRFSVVSFGKEKLVTLTDCRIKI